MLVLVAILAAVALFAHQYSSKNPPLIGNKNINNTPSSPASNDNKDNYNSTSSSIAALTDENTVITYLKNNKRLPDYYLTKNEARKLGWDAAKGNLCEVLPGRAIGGDYFSNRERKLPVQTGRTWKEADVNYDCGRRDAERIVFSNDGLIFITKDHYKTFSPK